MIIGLHHVQITIPKNEEEQAKNFYCDLLGLEEVIKPETLQGRGGFWLRVGNQEVHVGTENGVERLATKAHLAYQVNNLHEWRNKLEENGIEIIESVPIPEMKRFEFRDPFHNRVEMLELL
ncbi:VOC family protein [Alkalicoccus daliensis]|uniref:Catechol 2,3-dioxygenase n=1 Tax=Alkalicoccus daliensis TaxID=745820 RepID=A0A1G9Z9N6_9BACI|nr:VOC family protein [Alkalicoccus daliensis]SDN18069.1 Catechol 2,3-dioxygenase [Alkalicoccus daliensis]